MSPAGMRALAATFAARPYVVAFLAAFAVLAWSERGALRALLWLASGTLIGWLSEFCSLASGFPFGNYVYHKDKFPAELWLGPVPVFASLSFAFVSYFAFSAARRLRSPWAGSGWGISTPGVGAVDGKMGTLVLAAVIGTWMDTVIDPVALVGRHWFLGDLYHYIPPGPHFGVPITNYGGWLLTIGAIVLANQLLDRLLGRGGRALSGGPRLPLAPLWGIACCTGVFVFMLAVNLLLLARGTVVPGESLGEMLLSGSVSFALFFAFTVAMVRRGLARSGAGAGGAPAEAVAGG